MTDCISGTAEPIAEAQGTTDPHWQTIDVSAEAPHLLRRLPGRGAVRLMRTRARAAEERGKPLMFIAMNRFKVLPGAEAAFEEVWTSRDTHLPGVPGFMSFHLLRGPTREDHVLYSSHTIWQDKAAFENWTTSEAFRQAHRGAGGNKPLYLGHPEFEGFEVIQTVE